MSFPPAEIQYHHFNQSRIHKFCNFLIYTKEELRATMSSATIPRERALQLYRMILKELPPRYTPLVKRKLTNTPPAAATVTSSSQSQQSPLHDILRAMFTSPQSQATKDIKNIFDSADRLPSEHQASQLAEYLKAQRVYVHLLERYNPMLLLEDMERIRLTARRVGLDLPEEVK